MIKLLGSDNRELGPTLRHIENLLLGIASNIRLQENLKFFMVQTNCDLDKARQLLTKFQTTGYVGIKVNHSPLLGNMGFDAGDHYASQNGTVHFDIFSIYLNNYISLLALRELLESGFTYDDLRKDKGPLVKKKKEYRAKYISDPVLHWRNKVGAHYAASDPLNDNVATMMMSVAMLPTFNGSVYEVGVLKYVHSDGEEDSFMPWSVTEVYTKLAKQQKHLKPIPVLVKKKKVNYLGCI